MIAVATNAAEAALPVKHVDTFAKKDLGREARCCIRGLADGGGADHDVKHRAFACRTGKSAISQFGHALGLGRLRA